MNTINHELRTLLTTLMGHTELLQDLDLELPAEASLLGSPHAASDGVGDCRG